jgi:glycosyltransferase 2 family protein
MKTSTKTLLQRMVPGFFLGFIVFLGVGLFGDLRNIRQVMGTFEWKFFLAALLFTLFNYTLRFFKWHYYLSQIGVKNISWQQSMKLFIGGFPLAMTPGKVGEVLKGVWLKQLCGLPIALGISVVVAERISDGLAVLGLSILGVIAYPRYWPAFLTVLILLMSIVILSQIRPAALWLLDMGEKIPFVRKTVHSLREFYEGSFSLFKPISTLLAVGLGTLSWLGEGIGFYLILLGLGLPPSTQLLVMAVFTLSFSTIIGAVSALPGGLGAAEASIAGMLALLVGLNTPLAATATLLIRLATLWFGVLLGLLVWVISPNLIGIGDLNDSLA